MPVLYVGALFSSYKPLKFGIPSYVAVFLCGVYCISITLAWYSSLVRCKVDVNFFVKNYFFIPSEFNF